MFLLMFLISRIGACAGSIVSLFGLALAFFVAQAAGLDVEGKEYTSLVADFYHEMGGPEAAGCFGQGEAHRSVQQRPEGPLRERRRR